jgi:hypothetical protein
MLKLQVHAKLANGIEALPYKTETEFAKLVLYEGSNRYPPHDRDAGNCTGLQVMVLDKNKAPFPCGGDSWALPSVVKFAAQVQGVTWGDFSNMNGGFFPPHGNHREGSDIDGYFEGYEKRDGAVAQKLLDYLNQYGKKIDAVYVKFDRVASSPFWNAIKEAVLDDGRPAASVIQPDNGHATHFHWKLVPFLLQGP